MRHEPQTRPLSLYIVAAEESGDALGAALVRALQARHGGAMTFNGVGGRAMAAAGIVSPFAIDALSIMGIAAIPRPAAADLPQNSPDRRRRGRRAPRCAGDHRQSRFHPPGGPPRAPARAQNPDPRLRVALGLGVAARSRPRHARLCRSGARHPAVRAGGPRQARRAALPLCRSSDGRAHRRAAPQCRGGTAPQRRSCRRPGIAR